MTNFNIETEQSWPDFEPFAAASLSSEQIAQATAVSESLLNREQQWQVYLNALAKEGFADWLEERGLNLEPNPCSLQQPAYNNYLDGVFQLRVGNYQLCLLTNGVLLDDVISIDRALIELSKCAAHFYIVLEVIEEQEEVRLDCFISHQDFVSKQQAVHLTLEDDWTYEVPLDWFNHELDDLLLQFRCAAPVPIICPALAIAPNDLTQQLATLAPQLRSQPLHEVLTWPQAAACFSNPQVLDWLYQLQHNPTTAPAISTLFKNAVRQEAIKVKSWLTQELDKVAQQLAWTMLPPPNPALAGLRTLAMTNRETPAKEYQAVINQLRAVGEEIPDNAGAAYQDFILGNHRLRLFAVTWSVMESVPEWSLLLILGACPQHYLPQELTLQVQEGENILDKKVLEADTQDSYLYTQVIGAREEQFTVRVRLLDGTQHLFPNFAFL